MVEVSGRASPAEWRGLPPESPLATPLATRGKARSCQAATVTRPPPAMGSCSSAEIPATVSPEDIQYCEEGIAKLRADPACHSLLKEALTEDILEEIKELKTSSFGSTLKDVIQSGVENADSGIGVYAPDAEAYIVFAPLFNPIIMAYHGGFGPEDVHPTSDFGTTDHLVDLDPESKCVVIQT